MASRSLLDLHRPVYQRAAAWRVACEARNVHVLVYCTYRSPGEQAALYAQGRKPRRVINQMRERVGLWRLGPAESGRIVTNAEPGESWHQWRCAWDACPVSAGRCIWDADDPQWAIMGERAEYVGVEWGGAWRTPDLPHFQYRDGLDLADAAAGATPV